MKSNSELRPKLLNFEGNHCRRGQVGDWARIATPEAEAKMDRWIRESARDLDFTFKFQ